MSGSTSAPDAADDDSGRILPIPITEAQFKLLFYGGTLVYLLVHLSLAWEWNWDNKLFPLLVGVPLVGLIVVQMLFVAKPDIRQRLVPDTESISMEGMLSDSTDERTSYERQYSEFEIVGWTIALAVLIFVLGFAYAMPLFVFAFVRSYTGRLVTAVRATAVFVVFTYLLFVVILNLQLWTGILGLPDPVNVLPF